MKMAENQMGPYLDPKKYRTATHRKKMSSQ